MTRSLSPAAKIALGLLGLLAAVAAIYTIFPSGRTISSSQIDLNSSQATGAEAVVSHVARSVGAEERDFSQTLPYDNASVSGPGFQAEPPPPPIARLPVVLNDVDLSPLRLNEAQQRVVQNLRQQFVEAVGGATANPSDPKYLDRWRKAQPAIDERAKTLLGEAIFRQWERAVRAAAAQVQQ